MKVENIFFLAFCIFCGIYILVACLIVLLLNTEIHKMKVKLGKKGVLYMLQIRKEFELFTELTLIHMAQCLLDAGMYDDLNEQNLLMREEDHFANLLESLASIIGANNRSKDSKTYKVKYVTTTIEKHHNDLQVSLTFAPMYKFGQELDHGEDSYTLDMYNDFIMRIGDTIEKILSQNLIGNCVRIINNQIDPSIKYVECQINYDGIEDFLKSSKVENERYLIASHTK